MIEPGKGGAYFALFSEIGLIILVTTLGGSLVGYWIDKQLNSVPVFVVVGLLIGLTAGARAVYTLIQRFLTKLQ